MEVKLFDSELKVMEVLWKNGDLPAGQIARILEEETGWNRNTTYTVIKKCCKKGAVERYGDNFMCRAILAKKEAQHYETKELVDKVFDGSKAKLVNFFLEDNAFTPKELEQFRELIDKLK